MSSVGKALSRNVIKAKEVSRSFLTSLKTPEQIPVGRSHALRACFARVRLRDYASFLVGEFLHKHLAVNPAVDDAYPHLPKVGV